MFVAAVAGSANFVGLSVQQVLPKEPERDSIGERSEIEVGIEWHLLESSQCV